MAKVLGISKCETDEGMRLFSAKLKGPVFGPDVTMARRHLGHETSHPPGGPSQVAPPAS